MFEGRDRGTYELKWTASRVDLIFGTTSELCALAELYAWAYSGQTFGDDFVKVWDRMMNLDLFDLKNQNKKS